MPVRPLDIPAARARSHGPAIGDRRRDLDGVAFAAAVNAYALALEARGVRRGDVVAAMLPNRAELVIAMFAAWRLGAAFTPVNPALTYAEAAHQLIDSKARLVIVDAESAGTLAAAPTPRIDVAALPLTSLAAPRPNDARADDIALLIYTSGSTGRPKGVMLDHANLAAMLDIMQAALGLTEADRALLVLPLFHVNALLVSVLAPLSSGGSTMVLEKFDRRSFWRDVESSGATYFSGVPAIYILLNQAGADEKPDLSRLRFAICGAAPMPAQAIAAFEARYGVPLIEGYGLTESTVAATLNPLAGPRKPGTVGLPMPGVEIRIIDEAGNDAPAGGVGEVALRGPNVMRGYLGRPEESAEALQGGWLRTGDIGRFDADGFLILVDRKKDMIIRGGENIYPKEIENALYEHPDVTEAAVVGRPCAVMGEEVVAFVALREGEAPNARALADFLKPRLAPFKRPRDIRILGALPKNGVGKIAKPDLRAALREGG